ncbi:MAG: hypothetical protein ACRECE_09455, partial [Xanthobacteraceae bacterium]
ATLPMLHDAVAVRNMATCRIGYSISRLCFGRVESCRLFAPVWAIHAGLVQEQMASLVSGMRP